MTKEEKAIEQMQKLEHRARELRNALDAVESKWNAKREIVRGTPAWESHCQREGIDPSYNFGDVLA